VTRASDKDMDALHGALCGYFLKLIAGIERKGLNEYGELVVLETMYPSSGELAVMAKFLKDNAITGAIVGDSALTELQEKLADKHRRRGKLPTTKDVEQALSELGRDMLQ
jgi:hypothetical protein